ncbi:hypothetical protein B0H14DRAFT_3586534 [Mycena olivaceomarginata]|nr:hypothetical protein B0H14DRAFT_3586534 [Mycena olivaceomarginata]
MDPWAQSLRAHKPPPRDAKKRRVDATRAARPPPRPMHAHPPKPPRHPTWSSSANSCGRASKPTKADPPQQNLPVRKANNGDAPSNSGEIIEISSDEDDTPRKNPSGNTAKLEARIQELEQEEARIKKENDKLKKQQIACTRQPMTWRTGSACEICSTKLWSPFILDCGHTFCQQDLEGWFTKALEKHLETYSQYDVNAPPKKKKKMPLPPYTCPTCRDKVCSRPIQNFAVKGLVRAVAGQIWRDQSAEEDSRRRERLESVLPCSVNRLHTRKHVFEILCRIISQEANHLRMPSRRGSTAAVPVLFLPYVHVGAAFHEEPECFSRLKLRIALCL